MNVSTIIIDRAEAERKLALYRNYGGKNRLEEDDDLKALYAAVKKGAKVINVLEAFRKTGLNAQGQPKLAIAAADWENVFFHPRRQMRNRWDTIPGAGVFYKFRDFRAIVSQRSFSVRSETFADDQLVRKILRSAVPHIPPDVRPQFKLENYHVLFEIKAWEEYPVDPYLLRRIRGNIFAVLGEWELTELEKAILGE